uniref:Uncharacterized protein n=1 Tax=Timema shepardi TaxID=629360 RepID=A0A7R9B6Y5_TIMSH|nr:unnamed protein product [Timema shepardi]
MILLVAYLLSVIANSPELEGSRQLLIFHLEVNRATRYPGGHCRTQHHWRHGRRGLVKIIATLTVHLAERFTNCSSSLDILEGGTSSPEPEEDTADRDGCDGDVTTLTPRKSSLLIQALI